MKPFIKTLSIIMLFTLISCQSVKDILKITREPIPNDFQLANHGSFDPARMHYVDSLGDNHLFRGNLPIQDSKFVYDKLINNLKIKLADIGKTLDQDFEVLVISLINDITEKADLDVEKKWFKENSDKGFMINLPIYGALSDPNKLSEPVRLALAKKLKGQDKLPGRIEKIRELIQHSGSRQRIIYIHCQAGVDRTGEVIGSYSMRFLQMSYKDALQKNNAIGNRKISKFSIHGMRWYGYYLQQTKGISSVGPIE